MILTTKVNQVRKISEDLYVITEAESVHRYLLLGEKKALLIDAGWGYEDIWPILNSITQLPIMLAVTHGDPDHALGAMYFDEVWIHMLDYGKLLDCDRNIQEKEKMLEYRFRKLPSIKPYIQKTKYLQTSLEKHTSPRFLSNGDVIDLGGKQIEIFHTPGHSYGHIMFWEKETGRLFSGDQITGEHNIWYFSTNDQQAPFAQAYQSLKRIKERCGKLREIYPAHGNYPLEEECLDQFLECLNHELAKNYQKDKKFHSPIGDAYQHIYKKVNLIYSDERLAEYLKHEIIRTETE